MHLLGRVQLSDPGPGTGHGVAGMDRTAIKELPRDEH